jgi:hypothetical protein
VPPAIPDLSARSRGPGGRRRTKPRGRICARPIIFARAFAEIAGRARAVRGGLQRASRGVAGGIRHAYSSITREKKEKMESACKPGSVEDSHSSGIAVTGDLKRPTRKHGGTPAAPCGATSLFGLAPGGVCRAAECCHRRGALLPHRFTLAVAIAGAWAVCFLLHFPSAHAAQALPGTSSTGARTFLPISREMQRPSGRLRGAP